MYRCFVLFFLCFLLVCGEEQLVQKVQLKFAASGRECCWAKVAVKHVNVVPETDGFHNLSPLAGYLIELDEDEVEGVVGELRLAFDSHKLLNGQSPSDVQVYWWNEKEESWYILTKVSAEGALVKFSWSPIMQGIFVVGAPEVSDHEKRVNTAPGTGGAYTNVGGGGPGDSDPSVQGFDPSHEIIKSPSNQIPNVEPLIVGNMGEASFTFPIKLPPGRRGVQPRIELVYHSEASNTWLGEGWILTGIPSITIDTAFGVPRYNGDEKYVLEGVKLAAQGAAPGGGTLFTKRQEAEFDLITRKGSSNTQYTWQIRDQFGYTSYFGSRADGAQTSACTLSRGDGIDIVWGLCEKRDLYGNKMTINWDTTSANVAIPTSDLLPRSITYTGFNDQDGPYKVEFLRGGDSRTNFPIDCRKGWCVGTKDLLTRINVYRNNALIRYYTLVYTTGKFQAKLLQSVSEYSAVGNKFYTHSFDYYDDIATSSCGRAICSAENWNIASDALFGSIDVSALASEYLDINTASAIGTTVSTSIGYHIYAGVGFAPNKEASAGVGHGDSFSETIGLNDLIDLNGDRLPDKVFMHNFGVYYRPNLAAQGIKGFKAGDPIHISSLDGVLSFFAETGWTDTNGVEGYAGVNGFASFSFGFSFTTNYWDDVNGDGFIDLVVAGVVYYNHLDANGVPTFVEQDSSDTKFPLGFGGETPDTGDALTSVQEQMKESFRNNSQADMVTRWIAPYTGTIHLTVPYSVVSISAAPTPSLRVAIQVNGNDELYTQSYYGPGPGDTYSGTFGVSRGDAVYIRLGTEPDGAGGSVSISPIVQYTSISSTSKDANGLSNSVYNLTKDMVLWGIPPSPISTVYNGTCSILTFFEKTAVTTDDITALIIYEGNVMAQTTMGRSDVGFFSLPNSFWVDANRSVHVELRTDSPIDLSLIQVRSEPLLVYAASQTLKSNSTLTYSIDVFKSAQSSPLTPYTAPESDTLLIRPVISKNGGDFSLVITIKSQGQLLLKQSMTSNSLQNINFTFVAGTPYFIEASTRSDLTALGISINSFSAEILMQNGTKMYDASMGFNYQAPITIFNQEYRGWAYVGYNSTKKETAKIDQAAFAQSDQNNAGNGQASWSAYPQLFPFGWTSVGSTSFISPTLMNNTHLGSKYRDLNSMSKRSNKRGISLRGFPRIGTTLYGTIGGGVPFFSASISGGVTLGTIATMDMNGDQFPDILTLGGFVQSTNPDGTLRGISHMNFFDMETHTNVAENLGIGGSPAGFMGNGKGQVLPSGTSSGKGGVSRSQQPQFGVNGGYDHCDSDQLSIFIDINGDGLVDSCHKGDDLECRISIGYSFIGTLHYNADDINSATQDGLFIGPSLGWSDGIGGYGGGASFGYSWSNPTSTLMDMNGDGRPDAVTKGSIATSNPLVSLPVTLVAINLGSSFANPVIWGSLEDRSFITREDITMSLGGFVTIPILVWPLPPIFVIINPEIFTQLQLGKTSTDLRDVDGDGVVDQLYSVRDNQLRVATSNVKRTNLLKTVHGHLGSTHTVEYKRAGNTPEHPQNHWVISKLTEDDGYSENGNVTSVAFDFSDGAWDFGERVFRGFGQVTQKTMDSRGNVYRTHTTNYRTDSFYTIGLRESDVVKDAQGRSYNEYSYTYFLNRTGEDTYHPQLIEDHSQYFEGTNSVGMSSKNQYEYDEFGHIVSKRLFGDLNFVDDDIVESSSYSSDIAQCKNGYLLGLPLTSTQISFKTGEILTRTSHTVDCTRGSVSSILQYTEEQTQPLYTNFSYSPNGAMQTKTSSPNLHNQFYFETTTFDSVIGIYAVSQTNSHGITTSATYDYGFGLALTATDANGHTTSFTYDEFGRPASIVYPPEQGSGYNSASYQYQIATPPVYCVSQFFDPTHRGTSDEYFQYIIFDDGLGRTIQAKSEMYVYDPVTRTSTPALLTSGWIVMDDYGRRYQDYESTMEPMANFLTLNRGKSSLPPKVSTYDVMDRTVRTVAPDGTFQTYSFGFGTDRSGRATFLHAHTDPNGYRTDQFVNIYGYATSTKNYLAADYIWSSVVVDELHRITAEVDHFGNTNNNTYDMLGRTVEKINMDKGIVRNAWDNAGNLVSTVTSRLENIGEIRYDYDYFHLTDISYPNFPQDNVHFTWGGSSDTAGNRAGVVYKTVVGNGSFYEEFSYDNMGRIAFVNRSVVTNFGINNQYQKSAVYNTSFTYDTWGRTLTRTYGDGEVVHYEYNTGGRVESVYGQKGSQTPTYYVTFIGYNAYKWQNFFKWANNVNATYHFHPVLVDRVIRKIVTLPSQVMENITYTFDNSGVVVQINNSVPLSTPQTRTVGGPYTYKITRDPLYRIVGIEGTYHLSSINWQDFKTNFTFNKINAITGKWQTVTINNKVGSTVTSSVDPLLTYNVSYTYDSGRPHQASEAIQVRPGSYQKFCFLYDADGNTVTVIYHSMANSSISYAQSQWESLCDDYFLNRTNATYRFQNMVWDDAGRLRSISATGEQSFQFQYSNAGVRVAKNSEFGLNLYMDQTYEIRNGRGSKYYFAAGMRIAGKDDGGNPNEVCMMNRPVHSPTCQYFYHTGSTASNWVTEMFGKPVAYFTYLIEGEPWISTTIDATQAPAVTRNLPMRPDGNEMDENGYIYSGSYYNGALHMHL